MRPAASGLVLGLSMLGSLGCRATNEKSVVQGEAVSACSTDSEQDKGRFALAVTVNDFSSDAALETARNQIFEKYSVPEAMQPTLPIEVASKCGNVDDNTISIRAGVNLDRYKSLVSEIKSKVEAAFANDPGNGTERFKRLITLNRLVNNYNSARSFLARHDVAIAAIPESGAIIKFREMRERMTIGLKFSKKNVALEDGNVTRNIFKEAFVKMGLKTIDIENVQAHPDVSFAIELRYESLPAGNNSGQQFVRIYATVAMEDNKFATIAATTLEAKGGGVDHNAAVTVALRGLESQILLGLLPALLPDQA